MQWNKQKTLETSAKRWQNTLDDLQTHPQLISSDKILQIIAIEYKIAMNREIEDMHLHRAYDFLKWLSSLIGQFVDKYQWVNKLFAEHNVVEIGAFFEVATLIFD